MAKRLDSKEIKRDLAKSQKTILERIESFRTQIKDTHARELKKALIPVHEHRPANVTSGGIEDVGMGKFKQPVKKNAQMGYGVDSPQASSGGLATMSMSDKCPKCGKSPCVCTEKSEMCKNCGGMHDKMAKCGEMMVVKADLVDEKGNHTSNSTLSPPKDGAKAPKVSAKGSGGSILPGAKLKKALTAGMASSAPGTKVNDLGKEELGFNKLKNKLAHQKGVSNPAAVAAKIGREKYGQKEMTHRAEEAKKSEAPEVKNPSVAMSGNMKPSKVPFKGSNGGEVHKAEPLSKPPVSQAQRAAMGAAASGHSTLGIPKSVGKEFIDADKGGKLPEHKKAEPPMAKPPSGKNMGTSVPTSKPGLTKMAPASDKARMDPAQTKPAGSGVKLPGQNVQAGRAKAYGAAMAGEFQPKAPVSSGLELDKPAAKPAAKPVAPAAKPAVQPKGIFAKLLGR